MLRPPRLNSPTDYRDDYSETKAPPRPPPPTPPSEQEPKPAPKPRTLGSVAALLQKEGLFVTAPLLSLTDDREPWMDADVGAMMSPVLEEETEAYTDENDGGVIRGDEYGGHIDKGNNRSVFRNVEVEFRRDVRPGAGPTSIAAAARRKAAAGGYAPPWGVGGLPWDKAPRKSPAQLAAGVHESLCRKLDLVRHLAGEDAGVARALAAAYLSPSLLPAVLKQAGHPPEPSENHLLAVLASCGDVPAPAFFRPGTVEDGIMPKCTCAHPRGFENE